MRKPPIAPEQTRPIAEDLFRHHYPELLAIARNAGARSESEDVVSCALGIFISRFDPDSGAPPLPWLIVTVKREAWKASRKCARRQPELVRCPGHYEDLEFDATTPDLNSAGPEERVVALERTEKRFAALDQLKKNERIALGLKAFGYSYEEIQGMNGWTHTKVNRLMVEGHARLRHLCE